MGSYCCYGTSRVDFVCEEDEKNFLLNESLGFKNSRGHTIAVRRWMIDSPKGFVLAVPGLGANSWGKYESEILARDFKSIGFELWSFDFQGFGYSEGYRGDMGDWQGIKDDAREVVRRMLAEIKEFESLPFYLCGSSLGGAMSLALTLDYQDGKCSWPNFKGVILLAPALENDVEPHPCVKWCLLTCILPCCPLLNAPVNNLTPVDVFRVPEVVKWAEEDELFVSDVKMKTGAVLLDVFAGLKPRAYSGEMKTPYFLCHGKKDIVIPIAGSEKFHKAANTPDRLCEYMVRPDAPHGLIPDPDWPQIFSAIKDWINRTNMEDPNSTE